MKNKIFIGVNKGEFPPEFNNVKLLIAKDIENAEEIGNTNKGLHFDNLIEIGETDFDEQILFEYRLCFQCGEESIVAKGKLKELIDKVNLP